MKFIIAILGVFFTIKIVCQTEFAPIGCQWTYEIYYMQYYPPFNEYYGLYTARHDKDSIINGMVYKQIVRIAIKQIPGYEDKKTMLIREDNNIIYILLDKEYVLYNFNATEKDTIYSTALDEVTSKPKSIFSVVNGINYDTINGIVYKVQQVSFPCLIANKFRFFHQKFGYLLNNDLFFPENLCLVDYPYIIKLRCYSERNINIKNFDSIPCDSIRPDNIKLSTNNLKHENIIVFEDNGKLSIINNSNQVIKEVNLINLNGNLVFLNQSGNHDLNSGINISHLQSGLYFVKIIFKDNHYFSSKIIIQ